MSDPADKSDDLISELTKLMANPPQPAPAFRPVPVEAPAAPAEAAQAPTPAPIPVVRIPGMDVPRPAAQTGPVPVVIPATASATPVEQRAPLTGSIRIPGMDQPAPLGSAPVGKFDLGRPPQAVVRPEPQLPAIPSLSERIAARAAEAEAQRVPAAPAPAAPPIRFPELRTVSENRSFAQGPSVIPVIPSPPPLAPQQPTQSGDFSFDFGFGGAPTPTARTVASAGAVQPAPSADPIADLINADLNEAPTRPAPVIPVLRTAAPPRPAPAAVPTVARSIINAPVPLKPPSAPPRPVEGDRFAAAPAAGLNMRAPAPRALNRPVAPRVVEPEFEAEPEVAAEADPMAEIESLIGEAVRVELNPGPVRVQAAQPVSAQVEFEPEAEVRQEIQSEPPPIVPPLTTQFAPRRASLRDEGHAAAEDAILQATAATGMPVNRVEPMVDESPYRRLKVKPQRAASSSGGLRQYVGMAVAGTLLLAAGLGLYWVLNMGHVQVANGTNAPQLTADATPVKTKPDPAAQPVTDAANSPVLKQMEGVSQAPSAEQLVTTDQTAGQTDVADAAAPAAADSGENGLANRKVRTVTVRPDGTIVPGDDGVAGNQALGVDRPNVPLVPGSAPTDSTQVAALPDATGPVPPSAIPDAQSSAADAAASVGDVQPVFDPSQVAPVPLSFPVHGISAGSTAPLALAATPKSSVNAVVGAQTPNGPINLLADNSALSPTQAAPTQAAPAQAAPVAPSATPAAGAAAAYVQLASSTSASDAAAAVKSATAKYGTIFGDNKLIVQQADLGSGKGMRWRVRLPVSSFADATNVCAQIKAQGGDCFPTNG